MTAPAPQTSNPHTANPQTTKPDCDFDQHPAFLTGRRPLVAVTGPHKRLRIAWWATRFMLFMCGLRGVYLSAGSPELKYPVHGIVIGGGNDIEPEHYGALTDPARDYDPERDRFEMHMIRRALEADIPILGICRGAQLMNVVAEGSLYQDIRPYRKRTSNRSHITPVKWVELASNSELRRFIGEARVRVNSLHSQAINRLGRGYKVIGRDADGFIQAIEGIRSEQKTESFRLGVQWHPEYLPYKKPQRQLFRLFAQAVCESKNELLPIVETVDQLSSRQ